MDILILLIILGMAVVTYVPRALPAVIIDRMHFGPRFEKFLTLIPFTALSALIFPGVLYTDDTHLSVGLVGAGTALLLVLVMRRANIGLTVLVSILAVMGVYTLL